MSSPPWLRLYSETVHDAKLDRVAMVTGFEKIVVLGAWAGLLALSNESSTRGHLLLCDGLPFTVAELAAKIGTAQETLDKILVGFEGVKMVHWKNDTLIITNMDKRQFTSDHSTERVRKHREAQNGNDDETEMERCETVTVTIPESDTESEPEQDTEPESESSSPSAKTTKPPTAKPKTPAPTSSALLPDTPEARIMFAKLAANAMAHDPPRRGPKRFSSLEQKQKFIKAATRLDGHFEDAIATALEGGITSIKGVVDYIAKWQPDKYKKPPQTQRNYAPSQKEERLDERLQREEVLRQLGRSS